MRGGASVLSPAKLAAGEIADSRTPKMQFGKLQTVIALTANCPRAGATLSVGAIQEKIHTPGYELSSPNCF